jgi:hypothetical protein
MTTDDDDLAGRLQAKMTELRARQALGPEPIGRSLNDLTVRLDSHARLLETNSELLTSLLPLLRTCPRCAPEVEG